MQHHWFPLFLFSSDFTRHRGLLGCNTGHCLRLTSCSLGSSSSIVCPVPCALCPGIAFTPHPRRHSFPIQRGPFRFAGALLLLLPRGVVAKADCLRRCPKSSSSEIALLSITQNDRVFLCSGALLGFAVGLCGALFMPILLVDYGKRGIQQFIFLPHMNLRMDLRDPASSTQTPEVDSLKVISATEAQCLISVTLQNRPWCMARTPPL